MIILSLCDYTGEWPRPYREAGYTVLQVDIKPGPMVDIVGDVRQLRRDQLPERVHGILAAPPCTHLAGSGARWWAGKGPGALADALSIVDACLRLVAILRPAWWALENPVGRLSHYLGPAAFSFNPCDYGDPYTKRTLLWGSFTPPLPLFIGGDWSVEPTEGSKMWAQYGGASERTKTARSVTPAGFARAFKEANP